LARLYFQAVCEQLRNTHDDLCARASISSIGWAYATDLRIRRKLAMRVNYTNRPEGRGHTEAYGPLLRFAGFDIKDRRR